MGARGHNVTIVTPYLVKNPKNGVHYIHIDGGPDIFTDFGKDLTKSKGDANPFTDFYQFMFMGPTYCEGK